MRPYLYQITQGHNMNADTIYRQAINRYATDSRISSVMSFRTYKALISKKYREMKLS
jgi:hypothetical protein